MSKNDAVVERVSVLRNRLMKPMFVFGMAQAKGWAFPGAKTTATKAAAEIERIVVTWVAATDPSVQAMLFDESS